MRYGIELDESRCIACGACSVACMDENDIEPQHGDAPLIRCRAEERVTDGRLTVRYTAGLCRHCDDAPCMGACPVACIRRDGETGFVVSDPDECIGCGQCAAVCLYDAPVVDRNGKMRKCGGCAERVRAGLKPACVKVCPMDALSLVKYE